MIERQIHDHKTQYNYYKPYMKVLILFTKTIGGFLLGFLVTFSILESENVIGDRINGEERGAILKQNKFIATIVGGITAALFLKGGVILIYIRSKKHKAHLRKLADQKIEQQALKVESLENEQNDDKDKVVKEESSKG